MTPSSRNGTLGLLACFLVAACSSTQRGQGPGPDAGGGRGGRQGGGGGGGSGDGAVPPQCTGAANVCNDCCTSTFATGFSDFVNLVQGCVCGSGAPCTTACANDTYCSDGMVNSTGDACYTCILNAINGNGACASNVNDNCAGSIDCVNYVGCSNACPM